VALVYTDTMKIGGGARPHPIKKGNKKDSAAKTLEEKGGRPGQFLVMNFWGKKGRKLGIKLAGKCKKSCAARSHHDEGGWRPKEKNLEEKIARSSGLPGRWGQIKAGPQSKRGGTRSCFKRNQRPNYYPGNTNWTKKEKGGFGHRDTERILIVGGKNKSKCISEANATGGERIRGPPIKSCCISHLLVKKGQHRQVWTRMITPKKGTRERGLGGREWDQAKTVHLVLEL